MDELEISGKRYISTRRAAKEYKYHADYIGQLIRGKKLLGEKVGRSWYVEAKSLADYFGKSIRPDQESELKIPTEVSGEVEKPEVPVEAHDQGSTLKSLDVKVEPFPVEENITPAPDVNIIDVKEAERDSIYIPIRRSSFSTPKKVSTLRYVSDDTPMLPQIKKAARSPIVETMPRTEEEAEKVIATENITGKQTKKIFAPVLGIAVVGFIVFLGITMSSILVSSHIVIESGQPASVHYSLY